MTTTQGWHMTKYEKQTNTCSQSTATFKEQYNFMSQNLYTVLIHLENVWSLNVVNGTNVSHAFNCIVNTYKYITVKTKLSYTKESNLIHNRCMGLLPSVIKQTAHIIFQNCTGGSFQSPVGVVLLSQLEILSARYIRE